MSDALSVAELTDQRVELLPGRTVLSLLDLVGGAAGTGGAGGTGGAAGSVNTVGAPIDTGGDQLISEGHGGAGGAGGSADGGDAGDFGLG